MSEESIKRALAEERQLRRLLEEAGGPLIGLGVMPEGHEGPYHPTDEELREGYRRFNQTNAELANVLAEFASDDVQPADSRYEGGRP